MIHCIHSMFTILYSIFFCCLDSQYCLCQLVYVYAFAKRAKARFWNRRHDVISIFFWSNRAFNLLNGILDLLDCYSRHATRVVKQLNQLSRFIRNCVRLFDLLVCSFRLRWWLPSTRSCPTLNLNVGKHAGNVWCPWCRCFVSFVRFDAGGLAATFFAAGDSVSSWGSAPDSVASPPSAPSVAVALASSFSFSFSFRVSWGWSLFCTPWILNKSLINNWQAYPVTKQPT